MLKNSDGDFTLCLWTEMKQVVKKQIFVKFLRKHNPQRRIKLDTCGVCINFFVFILFMKIYDHKCESKWQ